MIKPYNGMKPEKITGNNPLPAGGYVAKIQTAKVEEYDWGEVLVVAFDVSEGDYAGFFRRQFESNQNEDKKWKGTLRLTVPSEGSQYFESNRRTFNNFIYALEDSNAGFHFDWDEKRLKDRYIGVLFRNKEWEWRGKTGWTTECAGVCAVDEIRSGDFKVPKDKPLPAKTEAAPATVEVYTSADDDDLPF